MPSGNALNAAGAGRPHRLPIALVGLAAAWGFIAGCATRPGGDEGDRPTRSDPPDATAAASAEQDAGLVPLDQWNRRWTRTLSRVVSPQTGRVDYGRLRASPDQFHYLVEELADPRDFVDQRERLAFLLNAYNALAISAVLEHYPVSSVREIDGFFGVRRFEVLGRSVTLDELRDRFIRPIGDPRVHAALVMGAAGSPPIRPEAYTAARLDEQLDDQARRFLSSRAHNTAIGSVAMLSPVFRWFAEDFAAEPYGSALGFARRHARADSPLGRLLGDRPDPPVTHLQFNWSLNRP